MTRTLRPVTVLTWGQEYHYEWATGIRVTRKGDLEIMDGLRTRAYHPAREWTSYQVSNPPAIENPQRSTK